MSLNLFDYPVPPCSLNSPILPCSRASFFLLSPKNQSNSKTSQKEQKIEPKSKMVTMEGDSANCSELSAADLWGEAYVNLKSQELPWLERYEKIVIHWLEANSILQTPIDKPLDDGLPLSLLQWKKWLCLQVRENYVCL